MNDTIWCAIYARFSSNNQREASIEDQVRRCKELALSKGWKVLNDHIYFDKAISGSGSSGRDGFLEMMRVAVTKDCPFTRIIVDDTSRIARNTKDALDTFSLLSFYNIHVYYVSQGIDTANETAEEMITVNGLIDSLYIRNLANQTRRGVEGQILKGYSGGGRRFGYRSEPVFNGQVDIYGNPLADGYRLRIDSEEAGTVLRIFKLYADEGLSAMKIAHKLNKAVVSEGTPKPPKGKYWSVHTILGNKKLGRGILNNELYVGRYYWNRAQRRRNPINDKVAARMKPKEQWVLSLRPHLRIVPEELWNRAKERQAKAQEATKKNLVAARRLYSRNLMTGMAKCGECGGNMVIVSGGRFPKYGCSNNWNKGKSVCRNESKIRKNDLESAVISQLRLNFNDKPLIVDLTNRVNRHLRDLRLRNRAVWNEKNLNDHITRVEKEIGNILNAIRVGIANDTVKAMLNESERKKAQLLSMRDAEKTVKYRQSQRANLGTVANYINNMFETLSLNPVLGRTFLAALIDEVVVSPSHGNDVQVVVTTRKPLRKFTRGSGPNDSCQLPRSESNELLRLQGAC